MIHKGCGQRTEALTMLRIEEPATVIGVTAPQLDEAHAAEPCGGGVQGAPMSRLQNCNLRAN